MYRVGSMMPFALGFVSDERGAMSVDFILWLPLFLSLLMLVTDASILYMTQTQMWNIARDTARRMTTQQIRSVTEATCYAKAKLSVYPDLNFTVQPASTTQYNTVNISLPVNDASVFGNFLGKVRGKTIHAKVTMRADPTKSEALPTDGECLFGTGGGGGGGPKGKGPKK